MKSVAELEQEIAALTMQRDVARELFNSATSALRAARDEAQRMNDTRSNNQTIRKFTAAEVRQQLHFMKQPQWADCIAPSWVAGMLVMLLEHLEPAQRMNDQLELVAETSPHTNRGPTMSDQPKGKLQGDARSVPAEPVYPPIEHGEQQGVPPMETDREFAHPAKVATEAAAADEAETDS